jgi:hypothetical protein
MQLRLNWSTSTLTVFLDGGHIALALGDEGPIAQRVARFILRDVVADPVDVAWLEGLSPSHMSISPYFPVAHKRAINLDEFENFLKSRCSHMGLADTCPLIQEHRIALRAIVETGASILEKNDNTHSVITDFGGAFRPYLALASNSQFVERAVKDVGHVSSVSNRNEDLRNCLLVTTTYTNGEINAALGEKCQHKDITKRFNVRGALKTQTIIEEGLLFKANSCTADESDSIKAFVRDISRSFTKIRVEKAFAEFEEDALVERAPNQRERRNAVHRIAWVNGRIVFTKISEKLHYGDILDEIEFRLTGLNKLHEFDPTKTLSALVKQLKAMEWNIIGLTEQTKDTELHERGKSFEVHSDVEFNVTEEYAQQVQRDRFEKLVGRLHFSDLDRKEHASNVKAELTARGVVFENKAWWKVLKKELEDDENSNLLLEYPDDVMMRKHLEASFAKKQRHLSA